MLGVVLYDVMYFCAYTDLEPEYIPTSGHYPYILLNAANPMCKDQNTQKIPMLGLRSRMGEHRVVACQATWLGSPAIEHWYAVVQMCHGAGNLIVDPFDAAFSNGWLRLFLPIGMPGTSFSLSSTVG